MTDTTPSLKLPFILPSQAQKHVTHNEALLTLDALVHLAFADTRSDPPVAPQEGTPYVIAANPSAEWQGRQNQVAAWQDGGWTFLHPREGWRAWSISERALKIFSDGEWRPLIPAAARFDQVGIAATPDDTNRLAVSSPATLLTHAGGGHQLKINKAAAADTASLLFQSAWTGCAELGLAGDNSLSVKVNDGNEWRTALAIDPLGRVTQPSQPMASTYRAGTTFSPPDGTTSGFTDFAVSRGGFTFGNELSGGGKELTIPLDGHFLLSLNVRASASGGHVTRLLVNGTGTLLELPGGTGFQSATVIALLEEGDQLTLGHSGSAQLALGPSGTVFSISLL